LRRARVGDVLQIQRLVNSYADKGEMLPRSLNDIYENLRDYFVFEEKGAIFGTVALHVNWEDLAEVRSLAVAESHTGRGFGRQLVTACIKDARVLGLKRVFALSYKPDFFVGLGWQLIEKSELPQKVWVECIRCVKFPDCGEVALIYRLEKK
jgi:amino-acid N-acetyltransferase